jgi:hypothetical protein
MVLNWLLASSISRAAIPPWCGCADPVRGASWYAAGHLAMDSDIQHLLPGDPPWRQREIELDVAFPQNASILAIVIDGRTPDLAGNAGQQMAAAARRTAIVSRCARA